MGSSARNSSGVHWCRCWVRFNEVPEKVPEVPEKVCVALAEPGQVQQGSGKGLGAEPGQVLQEALVQSQVKFNGVPEKVPEKVGEALVQSQVRFNRVPKKVPEKVWEALVQSQVRFNRVPEVKVWEALVQSQVRFNRVLEKAPEKVPKQAPRGFGAKPG